MGEGPEGGVCLRRCGRSGGWSGGVERGDPWWWVDGKCLVDRPLGGPEWGGLDNRAGLAGQGDLGQTAGFAFNPPPCLPAVAFGDAGEQQRQPAQQDVPSSRASALTLARSIVSRPFGCWRSQRPSVGWSRRAHSARTWAAWVFCLALSARV